jgi:hypothetical protein
MFKCRLCDFEHQRHQSGNRCQNAACSNSAIVASKAPVISTWGLAVSTSVYKPVLVINLVTLDFRFSDLLGDVARLSGYVFILVAHTNDEWLAGLF